MLAPHRNASAAQYFITSVLSVLSDPAVDGTFTDDVDGVPEEHPAVQAAINMTDAQLAQLQYATLATNMLMIEALVPNSKYNWQAFGAEDGVNGGPSKGNCAAWMRVACQPAAQGAPMLMQMDNSAANSNQTVAAFLISRPPYAYLGWGWESDDAECELALVAEPPPRPAGGAAARASPERTLTRGPPLRCPCRERHLLPSGRGAPRRRGGAVHGGAVGRLHARLLGGHGVARLQPVGSDAALRRSPARRGVRALALRRLRATHIHNPVSRSPLQFALQLPH